MLNLYSNINSLHKFIESVYEEYFEVASTYEEVILDADVLIVDKEKYVVEDIKEYLEFYKYKPTNNKKMSIINNFDLIDLKSQNKLLKIFEESEYLHIIVVQNKNKVLPTILSRASLKNSIKEQVDYSNYPSRYVQILEILNLDTEDTDVIDKYLKISDLLKGNKFLDVYLYITVDFTSYDEQLLYELIQCSCHSISVKNMINLQEKLFSNANKKLQIENFLISFAV